MFRTIKLSRRSLLKTVAAAGAGALVHAAPRSVRVAAIQLHPKLADVSANLESAERLIRQAIAARAEWIVLPEFFTSGLAFDPVNQRTTGSGWRRGPLPLHEKCEEEAERSTLAPESGQSPSHLFVSHLIFSLRSSFTLNEGGRVRIPGSQKPRVGRGHADSVLERV
jgi:hypothetical protein